jgi:hypothetical protein
MLGGPQGEILGAPHYERRAVLETRQARLDV